MSHINVVKHYFHRLNVPKTRARMDALIGLGYLTATEQNLYPSAIFIRYKTGDQVDRGTHVSCHGYVKDPITLEFREATFTPEKDDSTLKQNDEPVWPESKHLYEAPDLHYSHMPTTSTDDEGKQDSKNGKAS
ncbi:hypothetical protein E4U14_005647 [Claviceps sp. LM454 group G7]|nr:hypothetical protein E4U14_005647 [Claviceps sp. LM454 group G7]